MKLAIDKKQFKNFAPLCRHTEIGCSFHGSSECATTCRHFANIPKGHSWGDCSYKKCPVIERKI